VRTKFLVRKYLEVLRNTTSFARVGYILNKPEWRLTLLDRSHRMILMMMLDEDDDDDDDDDDEDGAHTPVWPTWAMGALCRGVR
jgi:hypothetical protein